VASKAPRKPTWWKNTFFLFSALLFLLALWGLIAGEKVIRDPGQIREDGLVGIYLVGGILMLVHGMISHQQAVQHFNEGTEEE
jgi:hypothetical protein